MAKPKRGMGRGLEAILSVSGETATADELRELPVELIVANPNQPRRRFDEEALNALAGSLGERGVLQPVLVRPKPGGHVRARGWGAALARRPDRWIGGDPSVGKGSRRRGNPGVGVDREHGAGGPQPSGGGPCVRSVGGGARVDPRGGGEARGAQQGGGVEPVAFARPPRRDDRAARAGRAQRGPREGTAVGGGPRR